MSRFKGVTKLSKAAYEELAANNEIDPDRLYMIYDETMGSYTKEEIDEIRKDLAGKIETVESIAKGGNQSISYDDYSELIDAFNDLSDTAFNVGQNIYIETVDVPDLWVSKIEEKAVTYYYASDEDFISELRENGYVKIGYYRLCELEGGSSKRKVDLTELREFLWNASGGERVQIYPRFIVDEEDFPAEIASSLCAALIVHDGCIKSKQIVVRYTEFDQMCIYDYQILIDGEYAYIIANAHFIDTTGNGSEYVEAMCGWDLNDETCEFFILG